MDRIEHERGEVRGLALTKAFELLDGPAQRGIIRSEQCEQAPPPTRPRTPRSASRSATRPSGEQVFLELNNYKEIPHIDAANSKLLVHQLDLSKDGFIERDDFMELCSLLAVRFKRVTRPLATRWLPEWVVEHPHVLRAGEFVRSRAFEVIIDCILLVNAIVLVAEQHEVLGGTRSVPPRGNISQLDSGHHNVFDVLELLFTIAFTMEMIAKLLAYGWEGCLLRSPNSITSTLRAP